jgi:hypothetical protein
MLDKLPEAVQTHAFAIREAVRPMAGICEAFWYSPFTMHHFRSPEGS